MKSFGSARLLVVSALVLFAVAARWLPHPPNFTPLGGMALFGAAYFAKKYWAYLIPPVRSLLQKRGIVASKTTAVSASVRYNAKSASVHI